jgi:hypothetical protein
VKSGRVLIIGVVVLPESLTLGKDGVIALTMGGVSAAECEAVAAFAEENVILYTPFSSITGLAK